MASKPFIEPNDALAGSEASCRSIKARPNLRLLTRDATRYRTYFPKVRLITPE